MLLTSPQFKHLDFIPPQYTCDGDGLNPPLAIHAVPPSAVSLALLVDDPDAPGGDWVHWLVWNMNPAAPFSASGHPSPPAVQGLNDFGDTAWGGPCPPSGIHRYQFKLFALDTTLRLAHTAGKNQLLSSIKGHILEETVLVGLYKRS